jgi:hypothetical protein
LNLRQQVIADRTFEDSALKTTGNKESIEITSSVQFLEDIIPE